MSTPIKFHGLEPVEWANYRWPIADVDGRTFSFQCDMDGSNVRNIRSKNGIGWRNKSPRTAVKWAPRLEVALKAHLEGQ